MRFLRFVQGLQNEAGLHQMQCLSETEGTKDPRKRTTDPAGFSPTDPCAPVEQRSGDEREERGTGVSEDAGDPVSRLRIGGFKVVGRDRNRRGVLRRETEGSTRERSGREIGCIRASGAGWTGVYEEWSIPYQPKSFLASSDGKPGKGACTSRIPSRATTRSSGTGSTIG